MTSPSSAHFRASPSPPSPAHPTSRPPRLSGVHGPPGGGNSGSAGPCRRWSGIDSIPPPTLTHIGAGAFIDWLTVVQRRSRDQRGERAGTVNLNVVPLRSLEATQIR